MRDMLAEHQWTNHPIIGYVPQDEDGKPYQPMLGTGRFTRKKPITVYKRIETASKYSPIGCASEVRMFKPAVDITS